PPEMWPQTELDHDDLIKGRTKTVVGRARGIRKDGAEIWVAITQRVIDWHGAKAVQINAFDISSQMAAEHALQENEQHLRAILEVLPYPIYITRFGDGQLLFVNRKTCLLFQKSAGQLLRGSSIDFYANSQERDDLLKVLQKLDDIRDVEVKMRTGEGREFT